jgi:hypothetical protein
LHIGLSPEVEQSLERAVAEATRVLASWLD